MSRKIEIYTDGSSLGNPGPGGYGVVVVEKEKIIKELGGYEKDTTNNRMELTGAIEALQYINKKLQEMKDLERMVHEIAKMRAEGGDAPTGDGSFADFTKFLETMKQKLDQEKQKAD